jgi:phage terminase large subunit-like protein
MGKYRFRTGDLREDNINVGASFNFGINMDIKNFTTNQELEDEIDGKFSVTDLKYTLGMSVFF